MLDKDPHGLKVLAINVNVKVRRAFNCSRDENLGIMIAMLMSRRTMTDDNDLCHQTVPNFQSATVQHEKPRLVVKTTKKG